MPNPLLRCMALNALAALTAVTALAGQLEDPIRIASGPITGLREGGVAIYKGIPYAKPPVGSLRWRPPQALERWEAPRAMTRFGPDCPQNPSRFGRLLEERQTPQDEDCLYLNVWTPAARPDEKLPVMVWIHGGGLVQGSGSKAIYDGAHLSAAGAVVVTFNYRVGPFGFFNHPDLAGESTDGAAGNYGILDQTAVLNWVCENIAAFGGDRDRVTIFGESAGASSVLTLMASPLARGLFHRAIAQSGAVPDKVLDAAASHAYWSGQVRKIGVEKWAGGLPELRALATKRLLEMDLKVEALPGSSMRGTLCVDGRVLKESPAAVFAAAREAEVPLIVGSNADEGTLFAAMGAPQTPEAYQRRVRALFPADADELLAAYPVGDDGSAKQAWAAALGDVCFTVSAREAARWHARAGRETYLYFFRRATPFAKGIRMGAFHGCEIPYVFRNTARLQYTAEDRGLSEKVSRCWLAFAATGAPAAEGMPEWRAYNPRQDNVMVFDVEVGEHRGVRMAECDLWDRVRARAKAALDGTDAGKKE